MQTHTQIRRRAAQLGCLFAPRRSHKQAGAGENSAPMRLENAAVDTTTRSEIISVDDQVFHDDSPFAALGPSRNAASSAASSCPAWAFVRGSARWRRSQRASTM